MKQYRGNGLRLFAQLIAGRQSRIDLRIDEYLNHCKRKDRMSDDRCWKKLEVGRQIKWWVDIPALGKSCEENQ